MNEASDILIAMGVDTTQAPLLLCAVLLLAVFCRYACFWIFLLKRLQDLLSNLLHICLCNGSEGGNSQEPVNNPLKDTKAKLCVDNGVGEVNASNGQTHSRLFGDGFGRWIRLGDGCGRLRVFFIENGRDQ